MRKTSLRNIFLIFAGILLCFGFSGCEEKAPRIVSIEPRVGRMGDILTIRGSGFGDEKNESYITIADTPPTGSYYLFWSDSEVSIRIPEFGDAGLVYVHRGTKKSNPALFANELTIPVSAGPDSGNNPRITSIEPSSGAVGSLITIQGSNFGSSREGSGVFFSWKAEPQAAGDSPTDFVGAFETEFGYELWSEREIRVRVPDGAVSGNLEVRTPRGNADPIFFEITGTPGTKAYRDKRTYVISLAADMRIERALTPNALYVWMPQPVISASQRNVELLSQNTEPFVENYRGTSLFQFVDTAPESGIGISLSYTTDVYAVETSVRNQTQARPDNPSPVGTAYTLSSALIPSEDPEIKAKAAQITGRERQPYAKARMIYDWLLSSAGIQRPVLAGGAKDSLTEGKADSYQAALLFCALGRSAGIPVLPVAGVLVDDKRNTVRHYWVEFWIDGFGWIPADPALGAGAAPFDFELREDHARYYFGSLDNRRIVFSRGERFLNRMTPEGRIVPRMREYSLQNLWEEAAGGLESYSSSWSDVTITGMYD